jgi:hypothetical protein
MRTIANISHNNTDSTPKARARTVQNKRIPQRSTFMG